MAVEWKLVAPGPTSTFSARNAVRLTDHDGLLLGRCQALAKSDIALAETGPAETTYLSAFEALLMSIHDVACQAYSRNVANPAL
ncbi:DUF1488 domain-containing protein [Mesorhizobium sp. B2-7-2]|uniref:DUF1488 domain-containing protein n=1 Tax=Mesorhizobium sp. B2-7-2 TaxID=2589908 RepID=UPI001FEE8019|nr:DUF1488 domain-containing protein [Mesorhizobium sp. B2-7-2]